MPEQIPCFCRCLADALADFVVSDVAVDASADCRKVYQASNDKVGKIPKSPHKGPERTSLEKISQVGRERGTKRIRCHCSISQMDANCTS